MSAQLFLISFPQTGGVCPKSHECCNHTSDCCDNAICEFCTEDGCEDQSGSLVEFSSCVASCQCVSPYFCIGGQCL